MTPELKAAAERLRSGFNHAQCPDHCGDCNDARALAEAYLAEHPTDDGEPVTLDWLRTLWKVEPGHTKRESYIVARRGLFEVGWCPECGELPAAMALDRKIIYKCPTRGQWRMLCRALGIPLKSREEQA
jgi:hypothetical protein